MSEFDQNMPDDFWRKAFEEAAEIPPPRVWDVVERRLNEDEGSKILPLWGAGLTSLPRLGWSVGLAAAVALLLVGWWALRTVPPEKPVARQQSAIQAERVVAVPSNSGKTRTNSSRERIEQPSMANKRDREAIAVNRNSTSILRDRLATAPVQPMNQPVVESFAQPTPALIAETAKSTNEQAVADAPSIRTAQQTIVPAVRAVVSSADRVAFVGIAAAPVIQTDELSSAVPMPIVGQTLSFDPVRTSVLRLREPAPIQRIVWFRPAEPVTEPVTVQPKRETRKVWASVSLMPGAFNPSVAVRSVQTTFDKATSLSNTSTSQPSVNSRANFSIAYQAGAGIQLTERWSVESGVGYLAGRSTVDSPVQTSVLNLQSATANRVVQGGNLYVDALRNSSYTVSASSVTNSPVANFDNSMTGTQYSNIQNSYNPQTRQSLSNDYQFVQVPVQVGYQLRPRKRLGLSLLGGFLSNIFVRNTVGDDLVITAKNGIYRPISWAATLGARFRYRPSRQWSASLAGVYQPSLGLGTRPESTVQTHPTSTGMSFGIDYHF